MTIQERVINDSVISVLIDIGVAEDDLTDFDKLVIITAVCQKLDDLKTMWLSNGNIYIWECVEMYQQIKKKGGIK